MAKMHFEQLKFNFRGQNLKNTPYDSELVPVFIKSKLWKRLSACSSVTMTWRILEQFRMVWFTSFVHEIDLNLVEMHFSCSTKQLPLNQHLSLIMQTFSRVFVARNHSSPAPGDNSWKHVWQKVRITEVLLRGLIMNYEKSWAQCWLLSPT